MSKMTMGPHEPNMRGNWWQRCGWLGEDEYEESLVAACARCGSIEMLDDHRDHKLCHDCWHAARHAETPYAVYRDSDGYCVCNGAYTKEEADDWAQGKRDQDAKQMASWRQYRDEATSESTREHYAKQVRHVEETCPQFGQYSVKPCGSWWGERIAHNGYMRRRRREIGSVLP